MNLVQSDAVKVLRQVEPLSSISLKRALGANDIISFADNEFVPLIELLKVIDEDYRIIVDIPSVTTSPVIVHESDPSKIITYDDFIKDENNVSAKQEASNFNVTGASNESDQSVNSE